MLFTNIITLLCDSKKKFSVKGPLYIMNENKWTELKVYKLKNLVTLIDFFFIKIDAKCMVLTR